jgi:L-ribulose-5-phosphate 3-epimerase UlaE
VFKTLAEINFWGPITVEMWAAMDDSGDPLAAAVAARRLVADLVAQAWPDPSEYSEPRHTQADQ